MKQTLAARTKNYCSAILISACLVSTPTIAIADDDFVTASVGAVFIELRTGPGRGYPVVDIAERGEKIELLKQRTDWIKIRTADDNEGWVRSSDIAATQDEQGQALSENIRQLQPRSNTSPQQGDWELGVMLGDYGGTDAISVYTDYHFTNNLAVELAASDNFGNFSSGQYVVASIMHQPFPHWDYSPFISLGGGVRKTNPRSNLVQTEDRTDDIIVAGIGMRTILYNRFVLRVQYNHHTVLTSRDDDIEVEEWKIGLSALF
jgi:uncharacterized protein YraI